MIMKIRHIFLLLCLFCVAVADAFGGVQPCQFAMKDGSKRNGKVITPDAAGRNIIVVFVNHREESGEANYQAESDLVDKLLANGISCCFYDQSPTQSSAALTLFEMADDAQMVYKGLKKNKLYKKFQIGFFGLSESGASAIIATQNVGDAAFLLLLNTIVMPEREHDVVKYSNVLLGSKFRPNLPPCLGFSYPDYVRLLNFFAQNGDSASTDALIEQAYEQFGSKTYLTKSDFVAIQRRTWNGCFDQRGVSERLQWNANQYLTELKCPILYVANSADRNAFGYANLFEFEKRMHALGNDHFTTILMDGDHFFCSPSPLSVALPLANNINKRARCNDLIVKWINGL